MTDASRKTRPWRTKAGATGGDAAPQPSPAYASLSERAFEGDPEALVAIVTAAEKGDEDAWACLTMQIRILSASVLRHAFGRADAPGIDDLSQMTAAELLEMFREGRFDRSRASSARGLISVIASRLVIRSMRRTRREYMTDHATPRETLALEIDESVKLSDEVFTETGLDRASFAEMLAALPEPERTAVILHARGCTLDQIAEHIGRRSRSGAHKALRRGLRRMLVQIKSAGFEPPP